MLVVTRVTYLNILFLNHYNVEITNYQIFAEFRPQPILVTNTVHSLNAFKKNFLFN